MDRATASATFAFPFGERGSWTGTVGWGRNSEEGHSTNAVLLESSLDLGERDVFFARIEAVQKTAQELVLPAPGDEERWLGKVGLTYVRQIGIRFGTGGVLLGIGAGASLSLVPAAFEAAYGGRGTYGFAVFLNARPAPIRMEEMSRRATTHGMGPHVM